MGHKVCRRQLVYALEGEIANRLEQKALSN